MPRGLPDYYNPDTLISQRLANVEEIVTQLRGVASVDNRGRSLLIEKFDQNLSRWIISSSGDGSNPALSTNEAYIPPNSVYFDCGTSGGSGNSNMQVRLHLGASAKLGLETALWYEDGAPIYDVRMRYNLGGSAFEAYLNVDPSTGDVSILVGGSQVSVGEVGYVATSVGLWIPVKLVADFENGIYQRLIVGQEQIDLDAYSMDSSAISRPGLSDFTFFLDATNAVNNDAFIGMVVITVDEP